MKNICKPGITLIELIIGLLLSSVLMTALFTIYGTITRTVARTTEKMERDRAIVVFQNQWQKDIEGIFAPPYPEKEQEKPEQKSNDTQAKKKEVTAKKIDTDPEKKVEKPKPIKKIFDSTLKDGSLNVLTFITSNPVAVYEKPQTGPKPRMVRVVYRLESDGKKPAIYRLMRQESDELVYEKFNPKANKPIKAYELIGNIKSYKVDYLIAKEEKQSDAQSKEKKKKGKKFKTVREWHSDERFKEKKELPLIPQLVRTTITIFDKEKKQDFSYSFDYQIAAYNQKIVVTKPVVPKAPELAKPPQPAGQTQKPGLPFAVSPRLTSLLDQIEKKLDEKLGMK